METPTKRQIAAEYLPEPGTVPKTIEHFESEIDLMSRSLCSTSSMGSLSSVFERAGLAVSSQVAGEAAELVVAEAARGKKSF